MSKLERGDLGYHAMEVARMITEYAEDHEPEASELTATLLNEMDKHAPCYEIEAMVLGLMICEHLRRHPSVPIGPMNRSWAINLIATANVKHSVVELKLVEDDEK